MLWNKLKLRRHVVLLSVVLSMCLALAGCPAPAPSPSPAEVASPAAGFEVTSLTVTPDEVVAGEAVTAIAEIVNTGKSEDVFVAALKVDGKEVDVEEVRIDPGASSTVSFTYSTDVTGRHDIEINGVTAAFTVLKPAEFEVGSLVVTPLEALVGDKVRIEAEIANVGEVKGSYTAELTVQGDAPQTKEVTLEAGAAETVFFSYSPGAAGTYRLSLDGQSATLKVMKPAPPEPAEVNITGNRAISDFPDTIAFSLEGSSALPVTSINLEYGTDKRSLVNEVSRVEPEYAPGVRIRAKWVWEMKKSGSIPPGAEVWWQWRITDEEERSFVTPRQSVVFEDTRYQWQVDVAQGLDVYWHGLGTSLVKELTDGVETRLSRIKLRVDISEERKPKVMVYETSEQLRSAILFTQEWAGAMAFGDYNIILIPVSQSSLDWSKRTLAHEITHLLVREATFGPFGDVPTWLNEGLAQYAEGEMEDYHRQVLEDAIKEGKLLSIRSLGSSFPTDPQRASLAYAQSNSLAEYLIEKYGWEKIRDILAVFKEGATYDGAVKKVYGVGISGLDSEWRQHIGAE